MLHHLLHLQIELFFVVAFYGTLNHLCAHPDVDAVESKRQLFLRLSAVKRGGAPGRERIQDGRPRRLPACGVWPDEAVLDLGRCGAALLPHAEGEAAAYQSQGALPVKRRPVEGDSGEGKGATLSPAQL